MDIERFNDHISAQLTPRFSLLLTTLQVCLSLPQIIAL